MDYRCSKRTGHVGVCLDNYLLIWGGYNNVHEMNNGGDHYLPPEYLWVYNTETQAWKKVKLRCHTLESLGQEMPNGTSGASANLLNGYLYVFGGHNDYGHSNHMMRLDLKACQWERIGEEDNTRLPSPRDKLTSWLHQDKLCCFGGYGPYQHGYLWDDGEFVKDESTFIGGWNNQLLVFDTHSNTWANPRCKGDVPSPRAAHAATKVGEFVYLYGGRHLQQRLGDLYQLDLDTFTWNQILNTAGGQPVGRSWHTFTTVTETSLFLYGGYTQDNNPLDDAWLLDIRTMQWSEVQLSDKRPRLWHTTCVTKDEDILVFGGCSSDILDQFSAINHCNDVLEFRVSPRSLLRLCLNAVFKYRHLCENYWDHLPKHLTHTLRARLKALNNSVTQTEPVGDGNNHGQTCAVS